MGREATYFTLTLESLRAVGSWAAVCAERALAVYEKHVDSDARPRAAIEGIRAFAGGGRRTAQLRSLALAAFAAARAADDPAAAAAARAAGSAAASAYTHPLADVQQTKHILGSAAYAALALELDHGGDPGLGEAEVRWAIAHVTSEVRAVLLQMPARQAGKSRLDTLLYELDAGIRGAVEGVVRPAAADDYDALCALYSEVDALHRDHLPQLFQKPPGPGREPEYYRALLADENVGLFVAEKDGRLVGFGHAAIRETPSLPVFVPRRYAVVDGIGVKAELRGGGIGSSLMRRIDEWAIAMGATAIELTVYEFNQEAIAFYQGLGFEAVSRKMGKPLDRGRAAGE